MQMSRNIIKKLIPVITCLGLAATAIVGCSSEEMPKGSTESTEFTQPLSNLSYWKQMHSDAAAIMKSYGEITAIQEIENKPVSKSITNTRPKAKLANNST